MKITTQKLTDLTHMRMAAECTLHPGAKSKATHMGMLQCEHSPIRTQIYLIHMEGIKTFVSVHLVRHKIGVEHFVQSMRDDRAGILKVVDRNTPVSHTMLVNAQALISMGRRRLCYKAHAATVGTMTAVRKSVRDVDPAMSRFIVPECVYRNGLCPEHKECGMGLKTVTGMYPAWPGHRADFGELPC